MRHRCPRRGDRLLGLWHAARRSELLLVSLFLPWYGVSFLGISAQADGLSGHGYLYIVVILCLASSFGGRWRPVTIGSPEQTSVIGTAAAVYSFFMFPVLSVSAVLGFGGVVHGPGGAGLRACAVAVVAGGALLVSRAIARSSRLPGFAEFDGQVIRQWTIEGDDDTPTRRCVAIDDGTSTGAWTFTVTAAQHRTLTPGTFVHVRVNPRRNRPLSIQPTEPPPVASRLASVVKPRQPDGYS